MPQKLSRFLFYLSNGHWREIYACKKRKYGFNKNNKHGFNRIHSKEKNCDIKSTSQRKERVSNERKGKIGSRKKLHLKNIKHPTWKLITMKRLQPQHQRKENQLIELRKANAKHTLENHLLKSVYFSNIS